MCERCGVGQYAPAKSFCQECPEGGKNGSKMRKLRSWCQGYTVAQVNAAMALHIYIVLQVQLLPQTEARVKIVR